jgi:hypothetical protein
VTALELGKHLRVSDLQIPGKVTVLTEPGVVVVHVVAPRAEEVAAPVEAVAGADAAGEPEVIKKGKGEGEAEAEKEKPEKKEKEKK